MKQFFGLNNNKLNFNTMKTIFRLFLIVLIIFTISCVNDSTNDSTKDSIELANILKQGEALNDATNKVLNSNYIENTFQNMDNIASRTTNDSTNGSNIISEELWNNVMEIVELPDEYRNLFTIEQINEIAEKVLYSTNQSNIDYAVAIESLSLNVKNTLKSFLENPNIQNFQNYEGYNLLTDNEKEGINMAWGVTNYNNVSEASFFPSLAILFGGGVSCDPNCSAVGVGIGAVIGGLLGGGPGAFIGGLVGGLIGSIFDQ